MCTEEVLEETRKTKHQSMIAVYVLFQNLLFQEKLGNADISEGYRY